MARKSTFRRDDVLAAALAVIDRDGFDAMTARRVGAELGASTAPVYSNFASMEELAIGALERGCALLLGYFRRNWTDESFLNMGIGYLHFAREHPHLFKALYFERHGDFDADARLVPALLTDLDEHPWLGGLPQPIKEELLFQAGIYSHGLATLICTGQWRDPDLDEAVLWLHSVGGLLVRAAFEAAGWPPCADLELRFGEFTIPWRVQPLSSTGDGNDA
jgi:AcrR family transcriptional regulator